MLLDRVALFIFRWLKIALVLSILGVVVSGVTLFWIQTHFQEQIRLHAEQLLRTRFPDHLLKVKSARIIGETGIELRGITWQSSEQKRPDLFIDELILHCRTTPYDIALQKIEPTAITARHLRLVLSKDRNGQWNYDPLFSTENFDPSWEPIPITIENSSLEIVDASGETTTVLPLNEIELSIHPADRSLVVKRQKAGAPIEEIAGQQDTSEQNGLFHREHSVLQLAGSFGGSHLQKIEFTGWYERDTGNWGLAGAAHQLSIRESFLQALPKEILGNLKGMSTFSGLVSMEFELDRSADRRRPFNFSVKGNVLEGRLIDQRLPYPLTNVQGKFLVSSDRITLTELHAECGTATVALTGTRYGYSENSPLEFELLAEHVTLDKRYYDSLPEKFQKSWDLFSPAGVVNADVKAAYDGKVWSQQAKVQCLETTFSYAKFPYRFSSVRGLVQLNNDSLGIELEAIERGQPIIFKGNFRDNQGELLGRLDWRTQGPIPLDEKLIQAFSPETEQTIKSLQPSGMILARGSLERLQPGFPFESHAELQLLDCSAKYEHFPYQFSQIQGLMKFHNDTWTLKLQSENEITFIECEGGYQPDNEGRNGLKLNFICTDLPLDERLRLALPPATQQTWALVQPAGTVDHVVVDLQYRQGLPIVLSIVGQKWNNSTAGGTSGFSERIFSRDISIEPRALPVSIEQITGTFEYKEGKVSFKNVQGIHQSGAVSLQGLLSFNDQSWQLTLYPFFIDRLPLNTTFVESLPENFQEKFKHFAYEGGITLAGGLRLGGKTGQEEVDAYWEINAATEKGQLQVSDLVIENLFGGLTSQGSYHQGQLSGQGELQLDSFSYEGVQVTNFRGPYMLHSHELLFGAGVPPRQQGEAPVSMQGRVFGGDLTTNFRVQFQEETAFVTEGSLTNIDFATMAQEISSAPGETAGKGFVSFHLAGTAGQRHNWGGGGEIRLKDANIYKLPVMLALLNLVAIQSPEKAVFTEGQTSYVISGDYIYLKDLELTGDALAVKGNGYLTWDKELSLNLYTQVGQNEIEVPIISPLLGEASKQLLLINVVGPLDTPIVSREPLPGINKTLQHVFPENKSQQFPIPLVWPKFSF
ncbi:MAG: hypothetical protein MPJ24_00600 [Pirellulaceae bacterium]|nr:hypothetical protein [Pirellulaceae bacterium]